MKKKLMLTKEQVEIIWENGNRVPNFDPGVYRKDHFGAWIRRFDYHEDLTPLSFGWLAVHIVPLAQGGVDDPCNLRPLQWENCSSGNDHLKPPKVVAHGTKNVHI